MGRTARANTGLQREKCCNTKADLQGLIATDPNGGFNQGLQININLGVFNKVELDADAEIPSRLAPNAHG
jgi:hypothetical protein